MPCLLGKYLSCVHYIVYVYICISRPIIYVTNIDYLCDEPAEVVPCLGIVGSTSRQRDLLCEVAAVHPHFFHVMLVVGFLTASCGPSQRQGHQGVDGVHIVQEAEITKSGIFVSRLRHMDSFNYDIFFIAWWSKLSFS